MPPVFAGDLPETARIGPGTYFEKPSCMESLPWEAWVAGCGRCAPIGAEVFEIERQSHSRTGVYENPCALRLVDTTSPADKLDRSENGFKIERFDFFFYEFRTRPGPGYAEAGIDVLAVDSTCASSVGGPRDRCLPTARRRSCRTRAHQLSPRFRRRNPLSETGGYSAPMRHTGLGGTAGSSRQPFRNPRPSPILTFPPSRVVSPGGTGFAVPMGKAWDDCSPTQILAGRRNEETAR
jgi:hypothetical protein